MKLNISPALAMPIESVTEKLAFLGRTGSGKTYAAMKLAELMLDAGAQIIAIDPVGPWHGLRIGGSWSVYIFGGLRGDFPLEPTGGKLMANLIADRGISAVLDISQFIRSEQIRFASDFIEQFYNRKKAQPSAVHIFIEEAQEFAPQNVAPNETHMLNHFSRAWKIGRNFGIGGSLISQRPQEVNKKVLNQASTLFAFNMTGPQERRAIADWTREAGIDADIESMLPKIKVGEPHVWSPTFLGISKTIRIATKITADVSMTPKVGSRAKEQPLTPIDVERLTADMADTVEKAKADDPKELRSHIISLQNRVSILQRELNSKPMDNPIEVEHAQRELKDAIDDNQGLREEINDMVTRNSAQQTRITELCHQLLAVNGSVPQPASGVTHVSEIAKWSSHESTDRGSREYPLTDLSVSKMSNANNPSTNLVRDIIRKQQASNSDIGTGGLRRIMIALAQYPGGRSARQIGVLARLSSKGGSFSTYLSKGRTSGWIEGSGSILRITREGLKALGDYERLPTGIDLQAHWMNQLGNGGAARILAALIRHHPRALTREALGAATELSHNSGSFSTYLSKLRTLELIEGSSELKASDTLFER